MLFFSFFRLLVLQHLFVCVCVQHLYCLNCCLTAAAAVTTTTRPLFANWWPLIRSLSANGGCGDAAVLYWQRRLENRTFRRIEPKVHRQSRAESMQTTKYSLSHILRHLIIEMCAHRFSGAHTWIERYSLSLSLILLFCYSCSMLELRWWWWDSVQ